MVDKALKREAVKTNKFDIVKRVAENYGIYGILVILIIVAASTSRAFLTLPNIFNVLRQVSSNGIISIGLVLVIIAGGIDISVGSVVGFTAAVFAVLYTPLIRAEDLFTKLSNAMSTLLPANVNFQLPVAIIIMLSLGALLGFINGIVICKAKVQPFIMTIGTLTLYRGFAYLLTSGKPVYMMPEVAKRVQIIGDGRILGVPNPVIILFIISLLAAFLLNRTTFGRYIRAIGGNQEAAYVAGINVDKYKIMTYVICGVTAAIAGIIITSRTTVGDPTLGAGFELDAIAACVIGGASLKGGFGKITGAVVGAIIIGIISNIMNLTNITPYFQYVVRGLIIILAVVFMVRRK